MDAQRVTGFISVEEYLAAEEAAGERHEYVDGRVYPSRWQSISQHGHNKRSGLAARSTPRPQMPGLWLRHESSSPSGKRRPFLLPRCHGRLRGQLTGRTISGQPGHRFRSPLRQHTPTGLGEKRQAYLSIPSLTHYILLEADSATAIVYERNGQDFQERSLSSIDESIAFDQLGITLPLRDAYDRVVSD